MGKPKPVAVVEVDERAHVGARAALHRSLMARSILQGRVVVALPFAAETAYVYGLTDDELAAEARVLGVR